MKLTLIALLTTTIIMSACSGGGSSHKTEQVYRPETVFVFCDSMSGIGDGWPEQLQDMAGIPVDKECLGGVRLSVYESIAQNNPPSPGGTYAVLQLGGNDISVGYPRLDIQQDYSDALDYLYNAGYSPVCYTYPNNTRLARADEMALFGEYIQQMCNERGYPTIISSEQTDGIMHYNDAGVTETAVNAWRVLFLGGE